MVSLLRSDHDDGGGVVPLAVLQDGGVCPHVLDHNTTLAVMPVNLDKSLSITRCQSGQESLLLSVSLNQQELIMNRKY